MVKAIRVLLLVGVLSGVFTISSLFVFRTNDARQNQPEQTSGAISTTYKFYLPLIAKQKTKTLTLGYYTGDQRSYDAVQSFSAYLRIVSADVFSVLLDGSIVGGDDLGVVPYDKANNIQTYACVSNYNSDPEVDDFDPALAHAAIVTHKAAVISQLVTIARDGDYEGINIDFENIAYSANINNDRMAFSAFIHDLAAQLHANGLKLVISVPGKTEDSQYNTWSYPFDFAALGQDADYLQLMTYDQHGSWSEPGPISGVDWVEDCVVYASSLVDPSRLLIGLPAYGYDWDLTASDPENEIYSASSFSWIDVPALLAKTGAVTHWDPASYSPSVTYTENGHNHEAWYENTESIHVKTALVTKYHLSGLSMWSLGQEDLSFWQAAVEGSP